MKPAPSLPPEGNLRPSLAEIDFDRAPFLVIWEVTRACDLACLHCRADAIPNRDPRELDTEEGKRMLEAVRGFGRPLVVLSGGDPLKRPDTVELIRHGTDIGLRMALTPSGTPLMTRPILEELKRAGLARLAVSLDASTAEIHDAFRGVEGSYAWTLRMLRTAREIGLTTQINTTVTRHNLADFERMIELMANLDISLWSVFFLVPTGRARDEDVASAEDFERVFHRMYDLSKTAPFDIKSTAAPQYRRVVLQRQVEERRARERTEKPSAMTGGIGFSLRDGVGRAKGVNDGNGFLFVNHVGDIYPSGFLPISAGNVRHDDLADVYRSHWLFQLLRDPDQLKGKCGVCEYRSVCGGSRARAYAMTGDPMAAEPFCAYVPKRWEGDVERPLVAPPRSG